MPLKKFLKKSVAKFRTGEPSAKISNSDPTTPEVHSAPSTTSIESLPTIISPPTASTPSSTEPSLPAMNTSTSAVNPVATSLAGPSYAASTFNPMTSPISNPLTRELHANVDKQTALVRAFQTRQEEIQKTKNAVEQVLKSGKTVSGEEKAAKEKWLAHQGRWIKWLENDSEKLRAEFDALEDREIVLREKLGKGAAGIKDATEVMAKELERLSMGASSEGKLGGEDKGKGKEVDGKGKGKDVEGKGKAKEVEGKGKGKGIEVVDGGMGGEEQKSGGEGEDEKGEHQDVEEEVFELES